MKSKKHTKILILLGLLISTGVHQINKTVSNTYMFIKRQQKIQQEQRKTGIRKIFEHLLKRPIAEPERDAQLFKKQPSKFTQTGAWLNIPANFALLEQRYGTTRNPRFRRFWEKPRYKKLISEAIAKEKEFSDTHYVFYHGFTKAWRVPQDLYLKLTQQLRPLSKPIEQFRFLRWETPQEDQLNTQEETSKNVADFLMQQIQRHGLINDNTPFQRAALLSVNLSLFGNIGTDGECTFHYFLTQNSHATVGEWVFKEVLDQFKATKKHIPELMKLDEKYLSPEIARNESPQEQVLTQIFIPKELVDEIGYISWARGIPREEEAVSWLQKQTKKIIKAREKIERWLGIKKKKTLSPRLEAADILDQWFKQKKEETPFYEKMIEGIQNNEYSLSKLLNIYTNNPQEIPEINNLQARLLFTNNLLLNPSSGIMFFDYDLIPKQQKRAYEKKLDDIVSKIVKEKLEPEAEIIQPQPVPEPQPPRPQPVEPLDNKAEGYAQLLFDAYTKKNEPQLKQYLQQAKMEGVANLAVSRLLLKLPRSQEEHRRARTLILKLLTEITQEKRKTPTELKPPKPSPPPVLETIKDTGLLSTIIAIAEQEAKNAAAWKTWDKKILSKLSDHVDAIKNKKLRAHVINFIDYFDAIAQAKQTSAERGFKTPLALVIEYNNKLRSELQIIKDIAEITPEKRKTPTELKPPKPSPPPVLETIKDTGLLSTIIAIAEQEAKDAAAWKTWDKKILSKLSDHVDAIKNEKLRAHVINFIDYFDAIAQAKQTSAERGFKNPLALVVEYNNKLKGELLAIKEIAESLRKQEKR